MGLSGLLNKKPDLKQEIGGFTLVDYVTGPEGLSPEYLVPNSNILWSILVDMPHYGLLKPEWPSQ